MTTRQEVYDDWVEQALNAAVEQVGHIAVEDAAALDAIAEIFTRTELGNRGQGDWPPDRGPDP